MAQAINLIIRAKDQASKTFTGAIGNMMRGLDRFIGAHPVLAAAVGAATAAIGAIVSVCKKGVAAYEKQHAAVNALATAHLMYGENAKVAIKAESALAAAIQDETGVGDEVTIQRMARMKALGMETKELGRAAKGVIALTKLGMSEEAAMRALAQASNGNYQALEQYIPALRTANTETEKADALNRQLANGYALAQADLNTFSGKMGALKGRMGDLMEVIGQASIKFLHLREAADFASGKINDLTAWMKRVTGYAEEIPEVDIKVEGVDKIEEAKKRVQQLRDALDKEYNKIGGIEAANEAIRENIGLMERRLELAQKNAGMMVNDYVRQQREEEKAAKAKAKAEKREQRRIDRFREKMKNAGIREIFDPETGERKLISGKQEFGRGGLTARLSKRDQQMWEAIKRKEADEQVRANAQKNIDQWKKNLINPVATELDKIKKEYEEARKDLARLLAAQ